MAESRYTSPIERIAQAIFMIFLIFGVIAIAVGIGSIPVNIIINAGAADFNELILGGFIGAFFGLILIAIGWSIRWLITGRSDRNIV